MVFFKKVKVFIEPFDKYFTSYNEHLWVLNIFRGAFLPIFLKTDKKNCPFQNDFCSLYLTSHVNEAPKISNYTNTSRSRLWDTAAAIMQKTAFWEKFHRVCFIFLIRISECCQTGEDKTTLIGTTEVIKSLSQPLPSMLTTSQFSGSLVSLFSPPCHEHTDRCKKL